MVSEEQEKQLIEHEKELKAEMEASQEAAAIAAIDNGKPTWREVHCPGCVYYAGCRMLWVKKPGNPNVKCYMLRVKL